MATIDDFAKEYWSFSFTADFPVQLNTAVQAEITLPQLSTDKYTWTWLDDFKSIEPTNFVLLDGATSNIHVWYTLYSDVVHQLPYTFSGPDGSLLDVIVGYLYISVVSKILSVPLYLLSSSKNKLSTYIDGRYYYIPIQEDDGTGVLKIHIDGINYTI